MLEGFRGPGGAHVGGELHRAACGCPVSDRAAASGCVGQAVCNPHSCSHGRGVSWDGRVLSQEEGREAQGKRGAGCHRLWESSPLGVGPAPPPTLEKQTSPGGDTPEAGPSRGAVTMVLQGPFLLPGLGGNAGRRAVERPLVTETPSTSGCALSLERFCSSGGLRAESGPV